MIKTAIWSLTLLVVTLFSACNKPGIEPEAVANQPATASPTPISEILVESEVRQTSDIFTDWKKVGLSSKKRLDLLEFADGTHGWIGGKDELFRTVDGGTTWEPLVLPFGSRTNETLFQLVVASPAVGWIVSREQAKDSDEVTARIYHTGDGGVTWSLQYLRADTTIWRLKCANESECVAVGSKTVQKRPLNAAYFALHTTDGGANWDDLSGHLSDVGQQIKTNMLSIEDVFVSGSGDWTVFTLDHRLLKTSDSGNNWKVTDKIDLAEQQRPYFIQTRDQGFNVFSGTKGKVGFRSFFLARANDNSWTKSRLSNIYIADAAYLDNDQVFACGSIMPEGSAPFESRGSAVILYSSDNGRSWAVVYQNKDVPTLNALKISDKDHIISVGDNGLVVTLDPVA